MDTAEVRTWIIFYLISFVVLLITLFFTTQGFMLGIGLTLIILVLGINFVLIRKEVHKVKTKKELMKKLSKREVSDDKPEKNIFDN